MQWEMQEEELGLTVARSWLPGTANPPTIDMPTIISEWDAAGVVDGTCSDDRDASLTIISEPGAAGLVNDMCMHDIGIHDTSTHDCDANVTKEDGKEEEEPPTRCIAASCSMCSSFFVTPIVYLLS